MKEEVFLNLLEIGFPQSIYLAELAVDKGKVIEQARKSGKRLGKLNAREIALAALSQKGLKFASDWECFEGKVLTFHDLTDESVSLREIIDVGTIEPIGAEEFADLDFNHERVFKSLLRRCMQQRLYQRSIQWQNSEHLFIFQGLSEDAELRKEVWIGKKRDERTVFERVYKKKSGDFLCHKHLAFSTKFERFGEKWYVSLKPDWFFSNYTRYRKSYYHDERVSYLKKNEYNQNVATHIQFLVHFLVTDSPMHDEQGALFSRGERFLTYGRIVFLDDAPFLDDASWRQRETAEKQKSMTQGQEGLFTNEVA